MMNYFSNRKKWVAYLVLLTFVFTCIVPTGTSFAALEDYTKGAAEYTQADAQIPTDGYGGSTENEADGVTISKTIAPTGIENYFDITLQVQTPQSMQELIKTVPTDVVLVMDISATMNRIDPGQSKSRLEMAQEAANQFIDDFKTMMGDSGRVGIVTFNTHAQTVKNLSTDSATELKATMDTIEPSPELADDPNNTRFTNIEAGLQLASNLLSASNVAEYEYIILLTDGFPTTYIKSDRDSTSTITGYRPIARTDVASSTPVGNDGVFHNQKHNVACWGCDYSDKGAEKAEDIATAIKGTMNIFTIGIGNHTIKSYTNDGTRFITIDCYAGDTPYVISSAGYDAYENPDAYKKWLENKIGGGPNMEGRTTFADGTNLSALGVAYENIFQTIEEVNIQKIQETYITNDPMGGNIEFLNFWTKANENTGYTLVGEYKINAENTATFTKDSGKIEWRLLESGYSESGTDTAKVYTYELKYRVRLENEVSGFSGNTVYNTNGTTTLNYKVNNNGSLSDEKSLTFAMPSVKGYLGELSFTKIDSLTNASLAGAEFTLTHKEDCSVCTAAKNSVDIEPVTKTSDANGQVNFTNIPSGHDYVLTESNVPDNYNDSNLPSYDVSVAYGVVTDNIPDVSGENVITNDRIGTISVEGTKTWVDGSNEDNTRPDAIVLNLYRYALNAENQKVVADELVNTTPEWSKAGDVWTYKFSGLEQYVKHTGGKQYEYTYYVVEESVSGYESAYNDENKLDINNTLLQKYVTVSGTKEWKDGNDNHKGETITLELFRDGRSVATTTTAADWSYSFGELPKYALKDADLAAGEKADGHVFEYQVREQDVPAGYVPAYDVKVDVNGNYTINITNNVRDDEKTPLNISGEKIWKDGEGQSVEVELFGNGTKIATTSTAYDYDLKAWTYKFDNLPKYDSEGKWITYTVKEVPVDGYISTVIPTEEGFDIINTPYVENQGQIAVKKVVTGENTPPEGTEFDFNLKIKAELDLTEFDAVVAKEAKALEDAHTKVVEKQTAANNKLAEAKTVFETSAFMTTASAYQFVLVDDSRNGSFAAVTSPSAVVYNVNGERVGVENEDADKTVLDSVLAMIEKLADSFSSLYNQASFLHQLAEGPVQTTSPSALAFSITDTDNLLKAYAEKRAADKLEASTLTAWQNYKVTTPTAINIFWNDNGTNKTVTMNPENDLQNDGWYYLNFKLFNDETNSFELKATTGSMITFAITESRPTQDNYTGTEITVIEDATIVDTISGLFTDVWTLTTESSYGFTFENKYEDKDNDNPPPGKTNISRSVEKVWNDNNNPDRPTAITVQLLRNGEVVETVTLSAANGWSYNWPELDAGYTWSVKEVNVADGYTASVSRSGNTFIITNTLTTTSTIPDETIPDENVPTGSVEPGEPLDDPEIPLGDAPATGDTNNAAPFMALMLFAAAGLVITRRKLN